MTRCTPFLHCWTLIAMTALVAGCSGDEGGGSPAAPTTTVEASSTTPVPTTNAPATSTTATSTPGTSAPATSAPTTSVTVPEPIVIGRDALSAHQEQMLASVDAYFAATGAETLGSGPPSAAKVQAVVDLFEPYGRLIWFNGVVYKVKDSIFADFVNCGGLPGVDPDVIGIAYGPDDVIAQSSSQLTVFESQVIWTGHDSGNGLPWVMVFSFEGDSTKISTLYVSKGSDTPFMITATPSLLPAPFTRDACQTTPTAAQIQDPATFPTVDDCLHFWVVVTAPPAPQYGPCYFFNGIYTAAPQTTDTGPSIMIVSNARNTCVKVADIAVGDLVEVWATGHPGYGIYALDIEIVASTPLGDRLRVPSSALAV
jgi:hypothetical protein